MAAFFAHRLVRSTALRSAAAARTLTPVWSRSPAVNKYISLQERLFHIRPALFQPEKTQSPDSAVSNPTIGSISTTSPSDQIQQDVNETKHAAFLGEADSNDANEAFRDAYAKRREAMDGSNSAYLGEGDSNDGFEIQRDIDGRRLVPLDAKSAAYLGEADSDDAFELDVIENPEAHTHRVDPEEAKNAAFLGEADSADVLEADREIHPERYSHRIEDTSPSGMHGETGQQDQ